MPTPPATIRLVVAALLLSGCAPAAVVREPAPTPSSTPDTVAVAAADSAERRAPSAERPSLAAAPADLPRPAREFRAAWISPVWAMDVKDWPSRVGMTSAEQQRELRALLDEARDLGLNAVVLHVRAAADALYPSEYAPWSAYLTGESGRPPSPYYDPLAFAVAEAHARGLQLHAWVNPFRALVPGLTMAPAAEHVTRAHPEWVVRYGRQTWIDPGEPAARRAVLDALVDIVRRYDVDGIHLDDYFYPYRERAAIPVRKDGRRAPAGDLPFPDEASWSRHGAARGWSDRAAWRRANVDDFVRSLYREVKAEKPWVLVGISPFGIWRSGQPAGVTGLDAYGEIYADARKWLVEGWVDYLAPQLYWQLGGDQLRFRRLDAWWRAQNVQGRHLWPGLFTSRVTSGRERWPSAELPDQVNWLRAQRDETPESDGHIHFRLASVRAAPALAEQLRETYAAPALVPASPWLGARAPARPADARVERGVLIVTPGDSTPVRWWLVRARDVSGRWSHELHDATDGALRTALTDGARWPVLTVAPVGRTELEGPAVTVTRR